MDKYLVNKDISLKRALEALDNIHSKCLVVVGSKNKLLVLDDILTISLLNFWNFVFDTITAHELRNKFTNNILWNENWNENWNEKIINKI